MQNPPLGKVGEMQTVLNHKLSCLLKGGLAFLLGKGGWNNEKTSKAYSGNGNNRGFHGHSAILTGTD